ncbi:SRPBCC domain-containing protein [bacterium]|nr:SRPBCC domain-containing protein [bacterium]MCI0605940.1 SRPBCC domain-containing protein [bacterium]
MSVKKEPSGRRSVQVEVEVPGTPEEVWQAISTGPGISSWFVPTEMDQNVGGKITMNFGPGMDSVATITAWEPPVRFAADSHHLGEKAPAFATEWFVEARSGGMCLVRVVHSLFAENADWDGELEGTETGWPVYFRVLHLYLSKFRGMHGKSMVAMGHSDNPEPQTWNQFTKMLALTGTTAGQRSETGSGAPQLSGIVESNTQHPPSVVLRLDKPTPGIGVIGVSDCGGSILLSVSLYLYGDGAAQAIKKQESAWQDWLNQHFPAPAPSAP